MPSSNLSPIEQELFNRIPEKNQIDLILNNKFADYPLNEDTQNAIRKVLYDFLWIERKKVNQAQQHETESFSIHREEDIDIVLKLLKDPSPVNQNACYNRAIERNERSPLWLVLGASLLLSGTALLHLGLPLLIATTGVTLGVAMLLIVAATVAMTALSAPGMLSLRHYFINPTPVSKSLKEVADTVKSHHGFFAKPNDAKGDSDSHDNDAGNQTNDSVSGNPDSGLILM
ncbi:MAG: hypothetical protein WC785_04525 [Tatlockia sp.]|jgi:hypothetical protein